MIATKQKSRISQKNCTEQKMIKAQGIGEQECGWTGMETEY